MADNTFNIVGNLLLKVDGAEAGLNKLKNSLSKLKMPEGLENSFKKSFANLDGFLARYKSQVEKGFDTKADVTAFSKTSKALDAELSRISKSFTELTGKEVNFRVKSDEIIRAEKELQTLIEQKEQLAKDSLKFSIEGGSKGAKEIETLLQKLKEVAGNTKTGEYASNALDFLKTGNIQAAITQLDKASASCKRFKQDKQDAFQDTGFDMSTAIQKIVDVLTGAESKFHTVNNEIDQTQNKLSNFHANQVQKAGEYAEKLANDFSKNESAIRRADGAMQEYARSSQSMSQQLQDLQHTTQYFFSLRNMINLFKRGIDDAIQSVKELDKAMTDTAVVTDYNISDLWGMLPEYTQIANELGATTQGAYETMTLYFQQGLDQQQAFEIGAETMKMARIAGLDYADATDMMTAALRGFNMELNETSAQRINDVYSKLAAVTASDTEELGTAMQRTASIAHSAGMSFEGTTAFLAQAIETTREPAENLGTAMKTIIARFQELKKNPLEIGEVEGEEVDYNKVDTALQSIGVSLKDTNGQFRDLDKVFLDISQRWDSLSQTQQRYIATIAAGSRQQSRFIAMMSNYDRTMELVGAANDSAGASEEQFGKTMDSLEAKLNKLHNAWQQFTMGIANNGMIKGAVDGITGLLTITNKLIDTFSLGIGPVKSLLSLLMAFTGLKMTGRFANSLIGGLGGILDPSVGFGKGFLGGAVGARQQASAAQAQMIYQPIVNELRALPARMKEQNVPTENGSQNTVPFNQQAFKQAKNNIADLTKYGQKYSAEAIIKQFKGLNTEQQKVLRNTMIGTASKVDTALLGRYGAQDKAQSKAIQIASSNFRNQAKIGSIAWSEYYNKVSDPVAMQKALEGNPKVSQATMEWVSGMAEQTTQQAKANVRNAIEAGMLNDEKYANVNVNTPTWERLINKKAAEKWEQMSEEQRAAARRKAWHGISSEEPLQNSTGTVLLDNLGKIGAGISSAGMGIQSFGALLTSSANPALQAFGGALTAIGGVLSSVGMGLSGLISGFNTLTNSGAMKGLAGGLSSLIGKQIPASAATGVLAGVAALTAIAVSAYKKHIQKLKDAGENVVKEYKEANEKYTSSISDLTTWQQELPRLQEGVDAYGNNVSLDTSDYERYREIINGIAKLNPDIVEGYNAQGDAIIRNNSALDQTLAKQRELQKLATEDYLSQQSLATLIRARDTTDAFKKDKAAGGTEAVVEAHNLISAMRQAGLGDSFFEALGFDYSKLQASHNNPEIQRFIMENEQIAREISEFYDQAGVDIDSHISEGLDNLTIAVDAEKEAIQDVYDNLMTYTSVNHLTPTNLTPNLQSSFNKGVELIAKSRLGAVGMQKAVENLSKKYNVLTDENSQYNQIMEEVRKGQEEYSRTLDASGYKGEEYRSKLLALADSEQKLADKTDVLQDKIAHTNLAEFYTTEAEKAFSFTNKQITDLTDAFAQFTDEINIAKNAYTDWQKQLENINSPEQGVNSYKQILDEVFKETEDSNGVKHQYNTEAKGRPELFTGAAQILSEEWLRGKDADTVAKKLKSLQPLFKEGQEGAVALGNKIKDALQTGEEFDGHKFSEFFEITDKGVSVKDGVNISDELTESLAHYWDMQTPALVAALQNASQYGISLMHSTADQRAALSNDVRSSAGIKSHATDELGKNITDLIVPRDVLVEGFHAAGEYNEAVISEGIKALRKEQGVFTTERVLASKNAEKLQKEYGITQDNFLKVLGQHLGADEAKETYEGYYGEGSWTSEQQTQYDEIQEGIQSALEETTSEVPDIASSVANIEGMLAAKLYESGDATNFDKLDDFHKAIRGDEQLIDTATDKLVAAGVDKEHQYTKKDFDQYYKDNESALRTSENIIRQLQSGLEKLNPEQDKEQYQAYSEQLKQAKEDYKYALAAKENADNYAKEQGWDGSSQPPSFSEAQIQNKINEVVAAGWGQLLNGIPSTALATPEAQNAMSVLAQNAFSPDMLSGPVAPEIQNALSTLGIDINNALQSGLDAWPDASETEAKVDQKGEELQQAGEEASSSMLNMVDTSWIGDLVTGIVEKYEESVNDNPINIPEITPTIEQGNKKTPETAQDVDTTATLTIDTGDSDKKLEATQEKATNVVDTVNQGATFSISVPGLSDLNKAARSAQSISKKAGTQTVGIKTSFDDKAVQTGVNAIKRMTPKIQVGADTNKAKTEAERARSIIDSKSATINVTTDVTGENVDIYITKHVKEVPGGYTGLSNKIVYTHVPQAGSLAGGTKKGRVGPRNQGGMTLTGELGYEIAWLPSQNKSVVLGAKGPQMVNLPKDAVVYNHEQSKDIMKKRPGVVAGSLWKGDLPTSDPTGSDGGGDGKGKYSSKINKKQNQNADNAAKVIKKIGNVNAWWWNMGKKVEATQRKIDKIYKQIQKITEQVGKSLSDVAIKGDKYIANLNRQVALNQKMETKANQKLKTLDKGKSSKNARKKVNKAEKNLEKAEKSGNKKKIKKAQAALKKAKKEQKKIESAANYSTISYDVTTVKKDKNGKKKKTKKTKKQKVNLAPYVKLDKATGAYVVDYNKINSQDWDKSKKKAVMEAAEKKIDDYEKKRNTATDNIEKAKDALDEFGQQLYETFFAWETELTHIWDLTQRIAEAESNHERAESFAELLEAQIQSGMVSLEDGLDSSYLQKITTSFSKGTNEQIKTIGLTAASIATRIGDLQNSLSYQDEETTLSNIDSLLEHSNAYHEAIAQAAKATKEADKAQQKLEKEQAKRDAADKQVQDAKKQKKEAKDTKDKKDDTAAKTALEIANKNKDKVYEKTEEAIETNLAIVAEMNNKADEYIRTAENIAANHRILDDTETLAYTYQAKALKEQVKAIKIAQQYMSYRTNNDGTITIDFDTDAFEAAKQRGDFSSTTAEKVQDYVKKLVEDSNALRDTYKDLTNKLTELHTSLIDLKEAWVGYSEDLMSILEEQHEEELNNFKTLSDAIKSSLDELLKQVKESLDQRRKAEDNAKTEQDIYQKQQRLASLKANTAGGNQVEIARLEKEIADAQLNYERTLEDQLLDRLTTQADLAASQRERSIQLQEAIYDAVNNAALVNAWMDDPAMYQEAIRQAFFTAKGWAEMPLPGQQAIETQFAILYSGLLTNQQKQESTVNAINSTNGALNIIENSLTEVGKDVGDNKANTDDLKDTLLQVAELLGGQIRTTTEVAQQAAQASQAMQDYFGGGSSGSGGNGGGGSSFQDDMVTWGTNITNDVVDAVNEKMTNTLEQQQKENDYKYQLNTIGAQDQITGDAFRTGLEYGAALDKETGEVIADFVARTSADQVIKGAVRSGLYNSTDIVNLQSTTGASDKATYQAVKSQSFSNSKISQTEAQNMLQTGTAYYVSQGNSKTAAAVKTAENLAKRDDVSNKKAVTLIAKGGASDKAIEKAGKALGLTSKEIKAIQKKYPKHEKGGLADYTGLGWLDGTPSKPELVLNATDTKNFIALKDVLSKVMSSTKSMSNSYSGNASYEININVDHLNNDYDVDKVAERVKKIIIKDSSYRNVTQVRNFR